MMHSTRRSRSARHLVAAFGLASSVMLGSAATPRAAHAQWSTTYEQYYLPGKFNFTFRRDYPAADRLFNAFDYGHAILYERLYNNSRAPASELEEQEYNFITRKLLVSPPRLPLAEAAIEVNYAKIAPEAKAMFDWAHLLHRQIYDVLASESMTQSEKDAKIAELVAYYKTRPDLAFSSVPKNMELMEGQPYSLAFRQRYPKFNGLIWGYHWLQVGLYEPLMIGRSQEERQAGVAAAVTRFRQMLENAPEHMPRVMPMTATIAPSFAKRYPEASIIFDNLHAMHDVVSDILANDVVPHGGKRAAILEAASRYRDDRTFLMPVAEWASMGQMIGIENMGGPAVGVLSGWTAPTIPRGITMADAMKSMPGMAGMGHGATAPAAGHSMPGMSMPGMKMNDSAHAGTMPGMSMGEPTAHSGHASGMAGMNMGDNDSSMRALHERMMEDPVIHERMMADTAMRRMMSGMSMDSSSMHMMHRMPASAPSHAAGPASAHSHAHESSSASRKAAPAHTPTLKSSSTKVAPNKATPKKASTKKAPARPMVHDMPGMKMPGMNMQGMNMPGMKP